MSHSVSLIINTYNRLPNLRQTLASLCQLRWPKLEVIVVDGPSSDGTSDYLSRHWAKRIKLGHCPEANLGRSRNIGLALASGDIVAYIDDDGLPEPDWLDELIPLFDDPAVAVAGGHVRDHTGVSFQCQHVVSDRAGISEEQIPAGAELPPCAPGVFRFPRPVGVNSAFRRAALLAIGGFDEHYSYLYDEVDTCLRLIDAGHQVRLRASAEVHHKFAPSHVRSPRGNARSWLPFLRSTAYYLIQNAPPGEGLKPALARLETCKQRFRQDTAWMRLVNKLPAADATRLLDEIEIGAAAGITAAFTYPERRLLRHPPTPPPWLAFRRRPAAARLRIALVSPQYPPAVCGGVGVFIHQLACELGAAGHEVTVITRASPGNPHTVDFEHNIWVHRIHDSAPPAGQSIPADLPAMPQGQRQAALCVLAELDRVNPRRRFHWVLGSTWQVDIAAVIASRRYRTALYLVTTYSHLLDTKTDWRDDPHFMASHAQPMMDAERWAMQQAERILASTNAIATDIAARYQLEFPPDRLLRLPFGIPPEGGLASIPSSIPSSMPTSVPASTAASPSPEPTPRRLLFVGRFERRKGIDLLLAAIPELAARHPDWHFHLVGDRDIPAPNSGKTDWQGFLERHRGADWLARVHAPGEIDADALLDHYRRCDLFVAPSRYESFGLIYLEAMRYAKPCVGTRAGGIPEVIAEGETGLLAEPDDSNSLAAALERLMADAELRARLGAAGHARYQQIFTAERFAERILAAFGPNPQARDPLPVTPA